MSVKRRLAAAGMPAAGVTVFAALALTGQPASAAVGSPALVVGERAAVSAPATCDPQSRVKCGYGDDAADDDNAGATATPIATDDADDSSTDDAGDDSTDDAGDDSTDDAGDDSTDDSGDSSDDSGSDAVADQDDQDDRGNGGYGSESPSPSPSVTPTTPAPTTPAPTTPADTDEVPGESPTVSPDDEDTLPVTGAPVSMITTIGALLAAAGAAIMFAVRRRRNA